jgi:exodeoxyribonuclease V alpha subunit
MDFIQSMLRIDEQVIGVGQRLYLKKYRVAEETVANLIRTKAVQHPEVATKWVPGLNAKQSEAFHLAMKKGICVITGGPGRGKTHILKKIVQGLDKRHRRSQILCPTGKAAARASELTFSSARTIHHWLYKTQGKLQQEIDTFILDECSMIDLPLFARFVKTLGEQHSLIMVGDVDQLPAVGPGKVFLDIIESGLVPAVRLTEIMRTDQLGIIEAADIVNVGSDYAIQEIELISDKSFLWHNLEGEDAQERVLTMVKFQLDAGVDPDDIQIICARNGYKSMASLILSNRELNYKVSSLLNASRKDVGNDLLLRPNDRVMNLKNKHLKNFAADREENEFCANGETGKIIEVSKTHYKAKFDQGVFRFSKTEDNLIQGYAATCHKFQGSEADHVIIVFDRTASAVLDRSWLYTAITRAAVSCNVIAPEKVFKKAIEKPSKISLRRSGLAELLQPQPLKAVI